MIRKAGETRRLNEINSSYVTAALLLPGNTQANLAK